MISQSTLDKVRDLDICEVVGHYTKLRRVGAEYVGLCPFHNERTPSFYVSQLKHMCLCRSCGKGGDGLKFIQLKEGLSFWEAVEFLAQRHKVTIEYTKNEMNDEQIQAAKHRESLLAVISMMHDFYKDELRLDTSDEARSAREYTYNRWNEEFCNTTVLGYAQRSSQAFLDYCKSKAISEDLLFELGLVKRDEKTGGLYAFFRQRMLIPLPDSYGRIIGFSGRYIGPETDSKKIPKYMNSINNTLFNKGEYVYGIHLARRCKEIGYFNIVEGAPDAMRLHSIGIENTVASLGTSWTDSQFGILKKFVSSLCFIPDSDPPKDEQLGPGFNAVIKNGSRAMQLGFTVTVKELPFIEEPVYGPVSDEEFEAAKKQLLIEKIGEAKKLGVSAKERREITLTDDEIKSIPTQKIVDYILHKNDADNHILSHDIYIGIPEKPLVVWIAEKRFSRQNSLTEEQRYVAEIAELLLHVKETDVVDDYIEQLATIYGKVKSWRAALQKAKGKARQAAAQVAPRNDRERDLELLRQFNLVIINNQYFTADDDDDEDGLTRLSNFILEPLYHIQDEKNGTRIFKMINRFGDVRIIELSESELNSLSTFAQRVGSLGNFVWRAKIDKLNNVKEYTYAKTDSAERIRTLGWDIAGEFFAFGNGILLNGKFRKVDDMGIIRDCNGHTYYIPATSKMYRKNMEVYQFERLMIHETNSGISLKDFTDKLVAVFGENAKIALCYLLATIFRDIVFRRTRHFPILNLFGEKGSGKTTLATCLQSFFIHGVDPSNLGVTSIPSMNDRISEAVNILTVFDEYKNDLDPRKIAFIKGMWGGAGQVKKNMNGDGKAQQTLVTTGIALCGQDKPTQDMALFTRIIFLEYHKTSFTQDERNKYDELVALCNMGLTHLTVEVLAQRLLFEKNFPQAYSLTKAELASKLSDEQIHDRIFGNWIIPLATFRTLESVLDIPFSYTELFELAIRGMRNQNEYAKESSEVANFWNDLQGLQTSGRCIDKAHFRIKYHTRFRPLSVKEDMIFPEAKPILYLNAPAVATLFNGGRIANSTANRSNWSTILSYLKSHSAFLGLKQDRFNILTPQGTLDFITETVGTQIVKRNKVSRPKALCFDYSILKEEFGLTLETEVITEAEEINEDAEVSQYDNRNSSVSQPKPSSLFNQVDEEDSEMPF